MFTLFLVRGILYSKYFLCRVSSSTISCSRIHRWIHNTQCGSAAWTCKVNQFMEIDGKVSVGVMTRRDFWAERIYCVVVSPVLSSVVLCGLWKQARGNAQGACQALAATQGTFQGWSRSCLVCGFGLLCIHTIVCCPVFSLDCGGGGGSRDPRDNTTAQTASPTSSDSAAWVPRAGFCENLGSSGKNKWCTPLGNALALKGL